MITNEIIPALQEIENHLSTLYSEDYANADWIEEDLYDWAEEILDESKQAETLSIILTTLMDYHLLDFDRIAKLAHVEAKE